MASLGAEGRIVREVRRLWPDWRLLAEEAERLGEVRAMRRGAEYIVRRGLRVYRLIADEHGPRRVVVETSSKTYVIDPRRVWPCRRGGYRI